MDIRIVVVSALFACGSAQRVAARPNPSLDVSSPQLGVPLTVSFADNERILAAERVLWYRSVDTEREFGPTAHAEGLSYTPTAEDCERWFKVVVADSNGARLIREFFFSRLPVCYIDVARGEVPSSQKETHDATLRIQGNGTYPQQYEGVMTIHVRGNSTRKCPKKPWKLKLDKATDVFGFGGGVKNCHWVMLANYFDESLMRNTIGFRLAAALGVANMKTEWVDVILNGAYHGCYQFCQHIRVDEDRVPVYDWEAAARKVAAGFAKKHPMSAEDLAAFRSGLRQDLSWITSGSVAWNGHAMKASQAWKGFSNDISGGYLWELSSEFDERSQFVVTSGVMTVKTMVNTPEYLYTNPEMMSKCREIWQRYWDACTTSNGVNSTGEHYSELCDVDSMVGYWLTMVTMDNIDSLKKSRYAYMDRGGKIVWGPVWDFDWGCGSPVVLSARTVDGRYPWSDATNSFAVATSIGLDDRKETTGGFYKVWMADPEFCRKLCEKYWAVAHPYYAELVRDGGTYDRYAAHLAEAGTANEKKWRFRVGFSGSDGDVARYKRFLKDRLDWLDRQFVDAATLRRH